MAFKDIVLPEEVSLSFAAGPEYNTEITITDGGSEQRVQNWQDERGYYQAGFTNKDAAYIRQLQAFFRVVHGRADTWKLKDWTDWNVTTQQNIGTGDTIEDTFQIVQNYTFGAYTESRTITKIVPGSETIYLNGTPQGSGYTLTDNTGVVVFDTPPGSGVAITAIYQFYVHARFDVDRLPIRASGQPDVFSIGDLPIIEVINE